MLLSFNKMYAKSFYSNSRYFLLNIYAIRSLQRIYIILSTTFSVYPTMLVVMLDYSSECFYLRELYDV